MVMETSIFSGARMWRSAAVIVTIAVSLTIQISAFHFAGTPNFSDSMSTRRTLFSSTALVTSAVLQSTRPSYALPFGESVKNRIQKELCIVNLLRLQSWAQLTATKLGPTGDIEQRRKAYLEARLGAKAMVAKKQKVGGGATPRVFTLVSLQIPECLDDLRFYAKNNRRVAQIQEDLTESLASIVEFDGLETTQDASPRSSLTMGQFSEQKATFVQRMLADRITPLIDELVNYFGPDTRAQCEGYIRDYYPSEMYQPSTSKGETLTASDNAAVN